MNMLLHGVKDTEFEIYHGDTLTNDWDKLRETNPAKMPKFEAIVANPPFSLRWEPKEEHYRFIRWHEHDWGQIRRGYPYHRLITGGDYNQSRDGAEWYGTNEGRDLLTGALATASLSCLTEEDFVASGKLSTRHNINHICGDTSLTHTVTSLGAWEGKETGGMALSDHNGVWVELAV